MKKQLPGWAVLLIITLAAGLALGATYALTEKPIAEQALLSADNARKAALPDADSFEELTLSEDASVDWAYAGLKEGNTVGYVAQKTVNGFGGKVEVIAGVDTTGAPETFTIGGISVGGSSFSETAGLGARSKEPAFTEQFNLYGTGTTFKEISYDVFCAFKVPRPPLDEQQEIADYLDEKTAAIDSLVAKKNRLVSELASLKKSLIFEYVTGKKEVPT